MRIQAKVQLKNFELVEKRAKLGYTQSYICISTGINRNRYAGIENLKLKPTEEEALEIALILKCRASKLFPNGYHNVVENLKSINRKSVAEYIPPFLERSNDLLRLDTKITIDNAVKMSFLKPKERTVIEMRNGLGDLKEPHTYEEIGDVIGVTRERVRQIEAKAQEKIRHILVSNDLVDNY